MCCGTCEYCFIEPRGEICVTPAGTGLAPGVLISICEVVWGRAELSGNSHEGTWTQICGAVTGVAVAEVIGAVVL